MIMNVNKRLWSLTCAVLPGVGIVLTCSGSYLVSQQTEFGYTWRVIPAYIMIVFGFLAVLIGLFWTIFHSKMYRRRGQECQVQVYTVERPSCFPPSYEESQSTRVCPGAAPEFVVVVDGVEVAMSLAPPLYSRDSSEAPDCTWSQEQPPRYSQVELIQRGEMDADVRREALSAH